MSLLRTRRFAPLFLTQLLGALNDNLFKSALVVVLTFDVAGRTGLGVDTLVNLSTALLILPFFLFSALAGQLADRFEKSRLIRALKVCEIAVMGLAVVGFHLQSVPLLLGTLFLMGTQSSFFGPLKYGVLPQHLEPEELVEGNGLVEMGTFGAILGGTIVGGLAIAARPFGTVIVSALVLLVALAGWLAARRVPRAPSASPDLRIDWNLARATWRTVGIARRRRSVFLAVLGSSWFWFFGALMLAQLPLLSVEVLGGDERVVTALMAVFSVGVGLGSALCARITGGRLELGLVPIAGLAIAVFAADLGFTTMGLTPGAAAIGPAQVPVRLYVDLLLLGGAGGLFIVPLHALVQRKADPEERSRVVAADNILNALFMVASAGFAIGLRALGLGVSELLLATVGLHLVVVVAAAALTRDDLLRFVFGRVVRVLYRVDSSGLERIPDEGPALVVSNHVSYLDAFIIGGLSPRPIRFVMHHAFFGMPGLRWLFRLCRVIPIASRREDPALVDRAYEEIARALAAGEVVGLFPEGKLTTDGALDAFRPGVERILARSPVPVVPVTLRGLWGSFFSHAGGPAMRKLPRRFWSRIEVFAGDAVEPAAATVAHLRQLVARGGRAPALARRASPSRRSARR